MSDYPNLLNQLPTPDQRLAEDLDREETVDLSRFVLLEVTFDPESTGESIPVIRVSTTEGLDHDELVTVEGNDFVPGEVVRLFSCPPGVEASIRTLSSGARTRSRPNRTARSRRRSESSSSSSRLSAATSS
jgi:hypothetical protein